MNPVLVRRFRVVAPTLPAFTVRRRRLVRSLDAATSHKLTSITAPTGYGKSMLLADWAAAHRGDPVAWLSASPADDDAEHFAVDLVAALSAVSDDLGEAAPEVPSHGSDVRGDAVVAPLLDRLADLPPCILVIDDLDVITNHALLDELGLLIEHSPPRVRFVVSGRSDSTLPRHHLRLRGELAEIRQSDLEFDHDEAKALVERVSLKMTTDDQIDALLARTEGWAAGLQMASITLASSADVDDAVARVIGADQHIVGYLSDEVLSSLPDEVQSFLLETSVLENMSAALCDAITGREDGGALLARLERDGLFVVRVGDDDQWYRYQRLFRTVLRHRLRTEHGDERRRALLCRAAEWHLGRDDVEQAADYLIEAAEWEAVLALVDAQAASLFEGGSAATARRWFHAVPAAVRASRGGLYFEEATLDSMVGNTLAAQEVLRRAAVGRPFTTGEHVLARALEVTWVDAHLRPEAALDAAEAALTALDSGMAGDIPSVFGITTPDSVRTVTQVCRARARLYLGEGGAARTEMELLADSSGYPPWVANVQGDLALACAWAGELRLAEEHARRALALVAEADLGEHQSSVGARLALAHVLLERDRLAPSEQFLADAIGVARRSGRSVPIAIHAALVAALDLARSEPERGIEVLDRLRSTGFAPSPPAVSALLRATEGRLLLALGDAAGAAALVDPARGLWTSAVASCAAAVAATRRDVDGLRKVLEIFPPPGDVAARLHFAVWSSVAHELDGNRRASRAAMAEAVAIAEPDGHVRAFADAGHHAHRILRSLFESDPTAYLRLLVQPDRPLSASIPSAGGPRLVEELSDRERAVLRYLPSRLSNAEIAEQMYVSLNTVKTHLRHIYRKLGVNDRREAIAAAEDLQLI